MQRAAVFTLVAAAVLSLTGTATALYSPSSPVVQLNPSNFKSKVLNSNGVVLVEFYAPWCGHCQALTPAWERAATVLKGVATVAALDADEHKALAQEYGIKGFPTIRVFAPGRAPVDYQGARDAKPVVEFALKQGLPPDTWNGTRYWYINSQIIGIRYWIMAPDGEHRTSIVRQISIAIYSDIDDVEFALKQVKALLKDRLNGKQTGDSSSKAEKDASIELNSRNFDDLVIKSKDLWIVEFFAPWCGHCKKLAPEWRKASNNLKGKVKLGHVDCDAEKSLMSRFNVQGFPTILVFGLDKDSPQPYEGARTASAIESFALEQLETNITPPEVLELSGPDVMESKCGTAAICFVAFLPDILDSKAEGRNKYIAILQSVAEKYKRSPYSYVWAASGKQEELEKQLGVGGYGYPALVALNVKKAAYVPLKSAFQLDQLMDFVKEAGRGGKGSMAFEGGLVVVPTEPWDGKDGQIIEEDEFSLEDLMAADDLAAKDEL